MTSSAGNKTFIDILKEKTNIIEIVGEVVRLKKMGQNYSGLCPFHAERTPSFTVSERKQIFHCFGCHKGGDAIRFVQDIQNISFPEAMRTLAQRAGIPLPAEFNKGPNAEQVLKKETELDQLYKLNRFVAQFFHQYLFSADGTKARSYLAQRGITDDFARHAYLGYAPDDWDKLVRFLEDKKAPLDKAELLGLIRKRASDDGSYYSLFRDRLMFPVIDSKGRVAAFGGRQLGNDDGPKYLNSPETPVFKKRASVYGLFTAQKDLRAEDSCIIVEGYLDCLSLQQAGIGNTVATLGTALTPEQIRILKRFTGNFIILFDGDRAGIEAQRKAMETFLQNDIVVRGVRLPEGLDPDDFVKKHGADALKTELQKAPFLLDQAILDLAAESKLKSELKSQALEQIIPWLGYLSSDTARLFRVQEVASVFDIAQPSLARKVEEIRKEKAGFKGQVGLGYKSLHNFRAPRMVTDPRNARDALDTIDTKFLELLICYPTLMALVENVEFMLTGFQSETTRSLVANLLTGATTAEQLESMLHTGATTEISEELSRVLTKALVEKEARNEESQNAPQDTQQEFQDLVTKLNRRGLEKRRDYLKTVLLKADASDQEGEFVKLMNEYNELVRKL